MRDTDAGVVVGRGHEGRAWTDTEFRGRRVTQTRELVRLERIATQCGHDSRRKRPCGRFRRVFAAGDEIRTSNPRRSSGFARSANPRPGERSCVWRGRRRGGTHAEPNPRISARCDKRGRFFCRKAPEGRTRGATRSDSPLMRTARNDFLINPSAMCRMGICCPEDRNGTGNDEDTGFSTICRGTLTGLSRQKQEVQASEFI